jgi:NhaC family Na+:H+ antiporter
MVTTIPSMTIALLIYLIAGFSHKGTSMEDMHIFTSSLSASYRISLWLLVVPLIMGILIFKKAPPIITLFIAVIGAGICALLFQPELLHQISGLSERNVSSLFKGLIVAFCNSTQLETGNVALNELVSTRGMAGMMNTIWLIICAMCFGGAMTASRMLESIISVFLRLMKRTVGLVASTVCTGLFMNTCTADQYLAIILTGDMFKDIYKQKGYESRQIGRAHV